MRLDGNSSCDTCCSPFGSWTSAQMSIVCVVERWACRRGVDSLRDEAMRDCVFSSKLALSLNTCRDLPMYAGRASIHAIG